MPSGGSTRKGGGGGSGGNNPIPSLSQRQPKPLSINQRQASTISFLLNDREVSVIEEARTLLEQSQMEFRTQMERTSQQVTEQHLVSLMDVLTKRESIVGRYNTVVAQSYDTLGHLYWFMSQQRRLFYLQQDPSSSSTGNTNNNNNATTTATAAAAAANAAMTRAGVMYRSQYRIQMVLYGTATVGTLSRELQQALPHT